MSTPPRSSHHIININTIFDTEAIRNDKNIKTSDKMENPIVIENKSLAYMVVTGDFALEGSGTGNLKIKANIDDIIRWFAMSESSNADSSVLIYNISKKSGADTFTAPTYNKRKRTSVVPGSTKPLPASFVAQEHWYMQSTVRDKGQEEYYIQFALYSRPESNDPKLYSYFQIAASINVLS
ncbi:inclusion body family protein [Pectobacterium carotovorum]|nr:inclusion body family protein [Pectobacterium carotovorum]